MSMPSCDCAQRLLAAAQEARKQADRTRAAGQPRNADYGDRTANGYAKAAGLLMRQRREQKE